MKINKYVNIDNNIFEIDEMIIEGTNLTANVQIPANSENCVYPIITDPIIKNNKLCIKKILLKVKPKCLKIIDNLSISLGDLSSIISINFKKIQITLNYTIEISNLDDTQKLETEIQTNISKKFNIDLKNITVKITLSTNRNMRSINTNSVEITVQTPKTEQNDVNIGEIDKLIINDYQDKNIKFIDGNTEENNNKVDYISEPEPFKITFTLLPNELVNSYNIQVKLPFAGITDPIKIFYNNEY